MRAIPCPYKKNPENVTPWRGESLLNKSICVQMEQGFGDIIQFSRFLPALKVLGAKKVVVIQESSLHHLIGQMECVDVFTDEVNYGEAASCDYWIGSLSLPYYISLSLPYVKNLFPISKNKVVGSEGYLDVSPSFIPKKIGVNWNCARTHQYHSRSILPEEMLALTGPDAYSLSVEGDGPFIPLPDDGWKKDWLKFARHVKALKGVVCVDTATTHVAAAMGVKVIVLLPKDQFHCWRWKNAKWYDSVTLLKPSEYHKVSEIIGGW
jgi:hypothetical protein